MIEEDKPFVCYRGKWSFNIVPRGGEGWRLLGLWLVPLFLLTGVHIALVANDPDNEAFVGWVSLAFVLFVVAWAVAMIRWMLARSEVINVDDLMAMKRQQDRDRRGRK